MKNHFALARKGFHILTFRLKNQGLRVTLLWIFARGIPAITGIPILKYSRVTPEIFVGSQYGQAGKRKLEQTGINGDVNMRIEFDDAAHGLAFECYCHLPTVDNDAPTLEQLREGIAFVDRVIKDGGKVYIHCAGGIGRAPTMAAAYLANKGRTLDEAIAIIKKARPFIRIMPAQMEQLQRFTAVTHKSG